MAKTNGGLLTDNIVDKVLNSGAGDESHPDLGLLHSELKPVTSGARSRDNSMAGTNH